MTHTPAQLPSAPGAVIARLISIGLFRSGLRLRVRGRERVPATGPVILACNHTGIVDGPMLIGLSPRPVHTLVKQEMFRGFVGAALVRLGQIALRRDGGDRSAIAAALDVLRAGRVLAIFPEGTRGAGDVATVQRGVGYLALRSGAPVVPVAVQGTAARRGGSMPRFRASVDVLFGEPLTLSADGSPAPAGESGAPHPATRAATDAAIAAIQAAMARTVAAAAAGGTGTAAAVPDAPAAPPPAPPPENSTPASGRVR